MAALTMVSDEFGIAAGLRRPFGWAAAGVGAVHDHGYLDLPHPGDVAGNPPPGPGTQYFLVQSIPLYHCRRL